MARRCFFSFHYVPDNWRASQVRNIGAIEGNAPVSDNDWESVTRQGDRAIERWIADQMQGRGCTVLLIGSGTAGRKWIKHEIRKTWNDGKGLVGVYIHNLKDRHGDQAVKGRNPFDDFTIGDDSKRMSDIVRTYDPPFSTSTSVYDHIKSNMAAWVEEAISIRNAY